MRLAALRWPRRWLFAVYGVLMAGAVVCVGLTGHFGGQLVHGAGYLKDIF